MSKASTVTKVERISTGALNFIIDNYENLADTSEDLTTKLDTIQRYSRKVASDGTVKVSDLTRAGLSCFWRAVHSLL